MIELKQIQKIYEGAVRVEALKEINVTIQEGEIFGVIGYCRRCRFNKAEHS